MAWALCDYVRYAPEVHEKLVVGLPYYGHQWETESQYPHSPGTNCSTLFYTTLAARADTYGRLWDTESLTPWYAFQSRGWNQGWYDDAESLGLKYDIVRMAGLQGVGIWALGYDGDLPELWELLGETFTLPPENDMITDNLEDCFTLHGPASYWHPYTEGGSITLSSTPVPLQAVRTSTGRPGTSTCRTVPGATSSKHMFPHRRGGGHLPDTPRRRGGQRYRGPGGLPPAVGGPGRTLHGIRRAGGASR